MLDQRGGRKFVVSSLLLLLLLLLRCCAVALLLLRCCCCCSAVAGFFLFAGRKFIVRRYGPVGYPIFRRSGSNGIGELLTRVESAAASSWRIESGGSN